VDDIMALYACEKTIERVCRYAPGEFCSFRLLGLYADEGSLCL